MPDLEKDSARVLSEEHRARMILVEHSEKDDFLSMAQRYFSELNPAFTPEQEWKLHYFEAITSNPQYFLRWIEYEGQKAGFILFGLEPHRFLPRKTGAIYELYITPEYRRRGVAKACAQEALRQLWQLGPTKIQLEVMEGRTGATEFWKSLGFRKTTDRYVVDRNAG